jgi:RibD C-terminal domain
MRKVIVSNFTSLDGYVAGVGNDVMALPFDPSFDVYNLERIRNADTLLTGRTTYQQLMAFWVPFADDPAASDLQREIGRFNRDVEKVVISDSLRADATPVAGTGGPTCGGGQSPRGTSAGPGTRHPLLRQSPHLEPAPRGRTGR